MQQSKAVFHLCDCEKDKSAELRVYLQAHPDVDVHKFKNKVGGYALHATAVRNHGACAQLLIDANADVNCRSTGGMMTPLTFASSYNNLDSVKVLIENKADVNIHSSNGSTPAHGAATQGHLDCLRLLINAKANVRTRTVERAELSRHGNYPYTPVIGACQGDHLACLQLLLENDAELTARSNHGVDALYGAMAVRNHKLNGKHKVPGMPFALLSCDTDTKNVLIDSYVTQDIVDKHVNEYKQIHNFIDEYHSVTKHALSEDVVVDTRMGRGDYGLYHEPLEQVLFYLGLSMDKDQTVNATIDSRYYALIPGQPSNANMWYELYQRTPPCSRCKSRLEKLKRCPCHTARYCNNDCQRQHWQTHKQSHKDAMENKTQVV
jgi:hypothetical protein